MQFSDSILLSTTLPFVLGRGLFAQGSAVYMRDEMDWRDNGLQDVNIPEVFRQKESTPRQWRGHLAAIQGRDADSSDDFTRQQQELQLQLQQVAYEPEKAQKIQQDQLNLMKQQQDKITETQRRQQRRHISEQQLELQQQLQNAAHKPEEAQKIQQDQLNLMKQQQDRIIERQGQPQRREMKHTQSDFQQRLSKSANRPKNAQKIQKQQLNLMKEQQDMMIGAQKKQEQRRSIDSRAAPRKTSRSPGQNTPPLQKVDGSANKGMVQRTGPVKTKMVSPALQKSNASKSPIQAKGPMGTEKQPVPLSKTSWPTQKQTSFTKNPMQQINPAHSKITSAAHGEPAQRESMAQKLMPPTSQKKSMRQYNTAEKRAIPAQQKPVQQQEVAQKIMASSSQAKPIQQLSPAQQQLQQEVRKENQRLAAVHRQEMQELAEARERTPGAGAREMTIAPGYVTGWDGKFASEG